MAPAPNLETIMAETRIAYFERFAIELPLAVAMSCSHPGECDADVEAALRLSAVSNELDRITPDDIRAELGAFGAWDDEELSDDAANRERILWLAAGNICEELDR